MKKQHHHNRKRKGHRNNGGGGAGGAPHPRPRPHSRARRLLQRGTPPDWKTVAAALLGGAGSAVLGGLIVNQKILSPEAVGLGLMLGGGATAYLGDGITRVVGFGIGSMGAGQLGLAVLAKQAFKSSANQNAAQQPATNQSGQPAAQLPAPPPAVVPPRQSANEGGVVLDLFRDAATDLDMSDDEWRFGMRDDPRDAAEPFVIDLDEAA
jgi:hypothetical protein